MTPGALTMEAAGESLVLLPQRALLWPAMSMLVIADIHFGKAASFRAQGILVPRGTTTENLTMLELLVNATGATRLLFLGDFLHARHAHAKATMAALSDWRMQRRQLAMTLIRGNHDSHAGDPPGHLGIEVVDEPYRIGPFVFAHHPQSHPDGYVLAGHVHPVYRLAARGDALRLPCFLFGKDSALLPSFGAFTGGHPVMPTPAERLYLATPDRVIELSARGRGHTR